MYNYMFTLIIPSFNAAQTLQRCLASAYNQQAADLEVLLMDGGSSDSTLAIAQSFADRLNMTIVSEADNGLYDAMNKGVALALGEWIVILGADDELVSGALERVRQAIKRYSADIYAGEAIFASDANRYLLKSDPWKLQALLSGIPSCHNAIFISRSTYATVGPYDTMYRVAADADWAHRAIRACVQCHQINAPLTVFHGGGVSSNAALTMTELCRIIQSNFPCLSLEEAEYLLYMAKGWNSGKKLEALLARHPNEYVLAEAANAARDYAPHCAQRSLDTAHKPSFPIMLKSAVKRVWRKLQCLFFRV